MKLYEKLLGVDPIQRVENLVDQGAFDLDENSNIIVPGVAYFANHAWVHTAKDTQRRCMKWYQIYWAKYGLISAGCHGCFKVVVRPLTLKQLFGVYEVQQRMGLPAKCGIERRQNSRGLYRGFWYAPLSQGLEGGRDLYKKVRTKLKQSGLDLKMILKRGCTEMEQARGASDQWEYTPQMAMYEDVLDAVIVEMPTSKHTPKVLDMHIQRKWIEWAWEMGDPTVWEYASKDSFPSAVTYHDSIHSPKDFPIPDMKVKKHKVTPRPKKMIFLTSLDEDVSLGDTEEANETGSPAEPAIAVV